MTTEFCLSVILFFFGLVGLDVFIFQIRRGQRLSSLAAWRRGIQTRLASFWAQQPPIEPFAAETRDNPPETERVTREASPLEPDSPASAEKIARVRIEAEVPADTVLRITITTDRQGRTRVAQQARQRPAIALPKLNFSISALLNLPESRLAAGLFSAALAVYLLTRLVGLTDFPIYFFGDEAIQTTSASDLLQRGMRGPDGTLLPTYFQNGQYFNLSASVYLQVLPQILFGKSIFVTRATSVLISTLAALCVGLMLRSFFGGIKRWWLASLLLSVTPAWFLHSRTAFETVLFVSFYAAFLYFYLDYRLRKPERVYWAVIFAGLAFYAYSPGQLVLAMTGILLFLSDWKYHWQQRAILVKAVGLLVLAAIPYLRFRLLTDYSPLDHLRSLGSYWIQPTSLSEKLTRFAGEYLRGLSPGYWFFDSLDLTRHQMRGYGNISAWFAPFMLAGIIFSLLRWRSPAHRLALLAALAAPSGAALAEIGITRILVFVIPASLLTALGLDWALNSLEKLTARLQRAVFSGSAFVNALSLLAFALLAAWNVIMLADALKNGPTWYTDYGLYGMQYGAKQVYQETVVPALKQDPDARFVVTPSWANGAEHFVKFFVPEELQPRVALGQVYDFIRTVPVFTEKDYFVVTSNEYEKISADPKFKEVIVRSTIPYPDGSDGFYIVNIQLSENIEAILAAEDLARRTPVEETVEWMGQTVRITHSPLSGGRFTDLIDGDVYTLAKGEQANPIIYEFFFSQPVSASELTLTTGSMRNFDVIVRLYPVGQANPITYSSNFQDLPDDPTFTIAFTQGPTQFEQVYLSIRDNNQGEFAQIHIREIEFR